MTVGEVDPVLPEADLLQAESLFVESRRLFDVPSSNGDVLDPGHNFIPPQK